MTRDRERGASACPPCSLLLLHFICSARAETTWADRAHDTSVLALRASGPLFLIDNDPIRTTTDLILNMFRKVVECKNSVAHSAVHTLAVGELCL